MQEILVRGFPKFWGPLWLPTKNVGLQAFVVQGFLNPLEHRVQLAEMPVQGQAKAPKIDLGCPCIERGDQARAIISQKKLQNKEHNGSSVGNQVVIQEKKALRHLILKVQEGTKRT